MGYRIASVVFLSLLSGAAHGAEPSASDNYAPGSTIGLPLGAQLPPGFFAGVLSSYYHADVVDGSGHKSGRPHFIAKSVTPALTWTPGFDILGGRYSMTVTQPINDLKVNGGGAFIDAKGLANPYVAPASLSWMLAPGLFVSSGVGMYLPVGSDEIRNHFWTFEPQLAVSYLGDGLDLTLHAALDINTKNSLTDYTTGDRLYVDVTATKKFGNWEIGPVGYVVSQVSADDNDGHAYGPAQPTFGETQRIALGGMIGYDFGPAAVRGYFTDEIYARNGSDGPRGWLGITFPIAAGGQR